ncbi:MAG: type I-G CRISPR-associated helicase/endonuclease Cas3g, partial [Phycisphaerae bacterium]
MFGNQRCPFEKFFCFAVGQTPYGFQCRFAANLPSSVNVPTGLGKTAMAVVGWLWRRLEADDEVRRQTPRRLVYCLPMRVLVEQTRDNAIRWLYNLGRLGGAATFDPPLNDSAQATPSHRVVGYTPHPDAEGKVAVYVLMGGEDEDDWDIHPEREAIIIGTQDMLLSRALNRGYAASRSRWPMQFGVLNTDCLWVFDEIQLMGSGLATTAQLEAFRRKLPVEGHEAAQNGHGCKSVWMSATLRPDWLGTVDFKDRVDDLSRLELDAEYQQNKDVAKRWTASKPLTKGSSEIGDPKSLATEVRKAHKPGTRTIVVVNTVKRACALYEALKDEMNGASAAGATSGKHSRRKRNEPERAEPKAGTNTPKPNLVLLHSRFRPADRVKRVEEALADISPDGPGTIVVSTQVIEAGVDVSATTLFTELAPWASLVQRFGRCNRRGQENEHASVRWIDVPDKDAAPYAREDLNKARDILTEIGKKTDAERSVGLAALSTLNVVLTFQHTHVIRKRDLIDLFDTTPDLAGNDIDI